MSNIKALIRFILFLSVTVLALPLQAVVLLFSKGNPVTVMPMIWHKAVCLIFGIKVIVKGTPATSHPVMFVSNHVSYLDIPVIGAKVKASFVAKGDVAGWPVFGFLSKMALTIFVKRASKDALKDNKMLMDTIATGRNIILFPEGTSSNGQDVLPFKSTLFALASFDENLKEKLSIQPFTVKMTEINRAQPMGNKDIYDFYAWYDDMTLAPHLWQFAKIKGATIELCFHDVLQAADYEDRKVLAKECEKKVASALQTDVTLAA